MSAIKNLIKAHKSKAITQDTFSLQDYLFKFKGENGAPKESAHMILTGVEAKYIPSFDKNSPMWNGQSQGNGMRTRFILEDGSTVGSFSNGAYQMFVFIAELLGYTGTESFLHIDIQGKIKVELSKVELDGNRSTYNFEILEEGSELKGFSDYLPTSEQLFQLEAPQEVAPAQEEATTETVEEPKKTKSNK